MKKLMIVAALICAATIANAAKVDWSASAVLDPWTTATAGKNTGANGWLGYCILAADYDTVTADLSKGDTTSLVAAHVGDIKTSSSKGAFAASAASGSVAAGAKDFYLIVLNNGDASKATYFYVSDSKSATVDASLDTTVAFPSQATNSKVVGNWTAMAPEPTSGLLLLIGMGALALKRKQKLS